MVFDTEEQDGFRPSYSAKQYRSSHSHSLENIYYRLKQLEKSRDDLERFTDELRLDRTTLLVNYTNLENLSKRNNADLEKQQAAAADLGILLNRRVDELRETITGRIAETQAEFHTRMNSLSTDVTTSLQNTKDDIIRNVSIDTKNTDKKFEENKSYLNRAIIGLAFGIVMILISIVVTKLF